MEPGERDLKAKTLPDLLKTVVRQDPDKEAIVEGETTVSYGDLERSVRSLAVRLYRKGIRQGDRVGLLLPNSIEFVSSYFAAVEAGAIVVPLNDHYEQVELAYFIRACRISILLTSRDHETVCQRTLIASESRCQILFVGDPEELSETELGSWSHLKPEIDSESPVMYQFSSGSTGRPKRIARNHKNLLFELDGLIQTLQITEEDRFLGVAPFSHVNGLMRSMMASIRAGATLYPLPRFERQAVAESIERNRISVFIAVPFMFTILARSNFRKRPDFSSLRLCISASAPMPVKHSQQFFEVFGLYVRQLYGSTETGTISVNLSTNIEETLDSVGTPIWGVDVRVFRENKELASPGEVGELAVKSPAMITEYEEGEDINLGVFQNGYFFTGDLGKRDSNGCLYLVGRKKFFINKGGYKIDPREIEEVLECHPKVDEAVAIGVPTAFGDEKVKAVVVLKEPAAEDEIVQYCRGKIADFKIPSLVEFRDSLPKSPTGKILRMNLV